METPMELYFAPLACSMASRIAVYETGATATFHQVNTKTGRLEDGSDFTRINPMGQVPVLRTDSGLTLTENAVVLQYIGERFPDAGLAPAEPEAVYRLRQWLSFIATELHKLVFIPLLASNSNDGAREFARSMIDRRFGYLDTHLDGREFLLDRFSVADAYLVTVLNWAGFRDIELAPWPALRAYNERIRARPHVAQAMAEELALFRAEQARAAATPV
jgi:glutathione S-transferase